MGEAAREIPRSRLEEVEIPPVAVERLGAVLDAAAMHRVLAAAERGRRLLEGRRMVHINSTARGGGVAEMLTWFLSFAKGAGIDVRWYVLSARPELFELTKRLHHLLHEDVEPLEPDARERYVEWLKDVIDDAPLAVRPGDLAVVHDPQPVALIPALAAAGADVVWRCHVGTDAPGDAARAAWAVLRPFLAPARLLVFSRQSYAWEGLPADCIRVINPSIDPLSPKNEPLSTQAVDAILQVSRIRESRERPGHATFERVDGRRGRVHRPADVLQDAPVPAGAPIVAQVSRWDPLKDPVGVMTGFVEHVPLELGAHLVLAGPAVAAVSDDPEGRQVLEQVHERWRGLPPAARARVHVTSLPMTDAEENAAVVNAIQRAATVVVQKSLREGFGLTVAEAMWKRRPVVASRTGGIQDQVEDGVSGLLLDDPADLAGFGRLVTRLLRDPSLRDRLGAGAEQRVRLRFLPDRHVTDWVNVIEAVETRR